MPKQDLLAELQASIHCLQRRIQRIERLLGKAPGRPGETSADWEPGEVSRNLDAAPPVVVS